MANLTTDIIKEIILPGKFYPEIIGDTFRVNVETEVFERLAEKYGREEVKEELGNVVFGIISEIIEDIKEKQCE